MNRLTTIKRVSLGKKLKTYDKFKFSGTQIIVIGFLILIIIGGLLLSLPISSADGKFTSLEVSMFTSVSATCVTGLTLVSSGEHWSLFGQITIILLIQIGGLGFMTLAVMLSRFAKRQITPREQLIVTQSLGLSDIGSTMKLIRRILFGTLYIELIGAVILASRFVPKFGIVKGIWYGIFHSISSFCNAGFDLFNGYIGFKEDYIIGVTLMLLIILGGIGFTVWDDVVNLFKNKKKLSVYSRFVIIVTLVLILSGAVLVWLFEHNNPNTLASMPLFDKIYHCVFQSVTTRTAGIDFIGNSNMTSSAQLICLFYMLIGGAAGSTAGGVKVGSFGVLVLAVLNFAKGNNETVLYNRRISHETVVRALTSFFINLSAGIFGGILICAVDKVSLLDSLYETISAISTVGLSLSISPKLSLFSHIVVMLLMFFGRVGILTITYSLLLKNAHGRSCISYPEVNIMI